MRMRGLKFLSEIMTVADQKVASYADAWIEIAPQDIELEDPSGRILRGCVE